MEYPSDVEAYNAVCAPRMRFVGHLMNPNALSQVFEGAAADAAKPPLRGAPARGARGGGVVPSPKTQVLQSLAKFFRTCMQFFPNEMTLVSGNIASQ